MKIVNGQCYTLHPSYWLEANDPYLSQNKNGRPAVICYKDSNTDLVWLVPLTTDKQGNNMNRINRMKALGIDFDGALSLPTNNGKDTIFLPYNVFPCTPKFLEAPYKNPNGTYLSVADADGQKKLLRSVLGRIESERKYASGLSNDRVPVASDILKIEDTMLRIYELDKQRLVLIKKMEVSIDKALDKNNVELTDMKAILQQEEKYIKDVRAALVKYRYAVKHAEPLPLLPQRETYGLKEAENPFVKQLEELKKELSQLDQVTPSLAITNIAEKLAIVEKIENLTISYMNNKNNRFLMATTEKNNVTNYLTSLREKLKEYTEYLTTGGNAPRLPERSDYNLPIIPADIGLNKIEMEKKKLLLSDGDLETEIAKENKIQTLPSEKDLDQSPDNSIN